MSAAAAAESPSSSSSSKEEDPASPPQSPTAAAAAAHADDDDVNAHPPSSPDPTASSANSDSSPTVPAPVSGGAALARPLLSPAAAPGAAAHHPSSRRLPPPCWTHEETEALIQSYRQKWYALRRGNLRASHWEEVADAVSRRCRHLYAPASVNSPKTAVQCRHKMEKLRKRYRSEKRRPHRTSWVHFREMDAMEMGTPAPATAAASAPHPRAPVPPVAYSDDNEDDGSDDEDVDDDGGEDKDKNGNGGYANTRSIHAVMSKTNGGGPAIGNLRFQIPKAVRSKVSTPRGDDRANTSHHPFNSKPLHPGGSNGYSKEFPGGFAARKPPPPSVEEMRKRLGERQRKEREGTMLGEMVAAVRMLGDGFIRVEEMKMEMAREMEKVRMEMELKRTEMILESQRRIVDAFVGGVAHGGKKKKAKVEPDS